ncbi:MAG: hypothetical protein GQ557_01465 [Mycoplasmataceae bacterium]|nr:hypothetical protein [Mycoplasmataceae bacterium]
MAFITNVDSSVLPYNDDDMKYDINRRQYVLTVNGFENWSGLKLSSFTDSPEEGNALMYEVSDDIYEYMYSISRPSAINIKRYQIAKDEDIREDFKKALMSHTRYSLRSSANLLKDLHGVNIEKGKAIDINSLRGRVRIAVQSESILTRIGLLYSGHLQNTSIDSDGTW